LTSWYDLETNLGTNLGTNLHVVLVAPEIPQNTGSIGRLCVATGSHLHLIDPLGFIVDDKHVRRAGLDYWEHVALSRHPSWDAFRAVKPPGRLLLFAARPPGASYTTIRFRDDDVLVFGGESRGLPAAIRAAHPDAIYTIPIHSPHVRSLNLANAVAIVLYEALRQLGAPDA
jgi:tRNA (cytidine/uridine-2'-O-)-methyltransferase